MPKRRSNTIANTTEGLIGGSGSGLSRTRNRIEDINILPLGNDRYEVGSDEGGTYVVDMNDQSCECG
ncbi:hypothetical protein [Clostridium perfringens]|uniref:hypothetical protein n=1 Tax=Clostridium perfringens TaxID=1502 RepID=UPI0024BD26FD|nr:hypothetical protein [Clostridium perfringens]